MWLFRQTTSVTRVGGPGGLLKVRVEIDKLGDLKLKISDIFGGRKIMGNLKSYSWFVNAKFNNRSCCTTIISFFRKCRRFSDKQHVEAWFPIRSTTNQRFGEHSVYRHLQWIVQIFPDRRLYQRIIGTFYKPFCIFCKYVVFIMVKCVVHMIKLEYFFLKMLNKSVETMLRRLSICFNWKRRLTPPKKWEGVCNRLNNCWLREILSNE